MSEILYQCVMSFCASLCFGIIFQLHKKKLYFSALGGMLGWLVFVSVQNIFPKNLTPCYFLAAVAITLFSECCARILRAPVSIFLAVSLIPLVPGNGIYQTMSYCIQHSTMMALFTCVDTLGIAGAMAFAVVVVSSFFNLFLSVTRKSSQLRHIIPEQDDCDHS